MTILKTKHLIIDIWEDFSAIFKLGKGFNLVNFTFIHLEVEVEYEKYGPTFEFMAGLLGFNLRVSRYLP